MERTTAEGGGGIQRDQLISADGDVRYRQIQVGDSIQFKMCDVFVIALAFRSRLSAKAAYNIFIEDLVLAKVLTPESTEKAKETFL